MTCVRLRSTDARLKKTKPTRPSAQRDNNVAVVPGRIFFRTTATYSSSGCLTSPAVGRNLSRAPFFPAKHLRDARLPLSYWGFLRLTSPWAGRAEYRGSVPGPQGRGSGRGAARRCRCRGVVRPARAITPQRRRRAGARRAPTRRQPVADRDRLDAPARSIHPSQHC